MQRFNLSLNIYMVDHMNNHTARINMQKQQLRTNNVLDESILALYDLIPRHQFVPEQFAHFAYSDMQIPLAHGQNMLTPLEEGIILQALKLEGHETVLEIGTGSGFFTALLSRLCKKVISVEYYADLTTQAAAQLKAQHCDNVTLITGDGCQGWLEQAPYDVVVFTGAVAALNQTHRLQIVPGGRIMAIEGTSPLMQGALYALSHDEVWSKSMLFETNTPLLVNPLQTKEFVF